MWHDSLTNDQQPGGADGGPSVGRHRRGQGPGRARRPRVDLLGPSRRVRGDAPPRGRARPAGARGGHLQPGEPRRRLHGDATGRLPRAGHGAGALGRARAGSAPARRRSPRAQSVAPRAGGRRDGQGRGARGPVRDRRLPETAPRRVDAMRRRRRDATALPRRDRANVRPSSRPSRKRPRRACPPPGIS